MENGGSGVFIQTPEGQTLESAIPAGAHCTNYKAEAEAIHEALNLLEGITNEKSKVVILSDAKSVLQTLENNRCEYEALTNRLQATRQNVKSLVLQWIPGHCNIMGNEKADNLAKTGSSLEQTAETLTFQEVRTIIKSEMKGRWKAKHPQHNSKDSYYSLDRMDQTTIFRLRTGHNKLRHHLHKTFKVGDSDQCKCNTAAETTEHIL